MPTELELDGMNGVNTLEVRAPEDALDEADLGDVEGLEALLEEARPSRWQRFALWLRRFVGGSKHAEPVETPADDDDDLAAIAAAIREAKDPAEATMILARVVKHVHDEAGVAALAADKAECERARLALVAHMRSALNPLNMNPPTPVAASSRRNGPLLH